MTQDTRVRQIQFGYECNDDLWLIGILAGIALIVGLVAEFAL